MERVKNIWVVGGDRRQAELARLLAEDGHSVHPFALEQEIACEESMEELEWADCVILPLPAVTGEGWLNTPLCGQTHRVEEVLDQMEQGQLLCAGMVMPQLREEAERRGLILCDYFAMEELAVANAVPTAEGAIQIAMEELPVTLHNARVLILGYGRVARVTAQRMAVLGAKVTVAARSYEQLAWARVWGFSTEYITGIAPWLCGYDLIVNTVPAQILRREELSALREGTVVIDLASRPGGVDFEAAKELGVKVMWALALPGKVAPRSAAQYIKTAIYHRMEELGG